MKKYDAVIIGFGKGGKTLAAELAGHDRSVAMIERSDKMYGGTCINIGCIPTKALIHSAGLAAASHPPKNARWSICSATRTITIWPTTPGSTSTRAKGGSSRRRPWR